MRVFRQGSSSLAYARRGAGPPLVLLHGLSGSAAWWRRNVPALAQHFCVYTVDLMGFGKSRRQHPLPLREAARLLEAWLGALELRQPRLIGHSMGAHIGLHLAARYPLGALVLVAASALVRDPWWRMSLRLPQAAWHGAWEFLPTLAWDALRAGPRNLYRATQEIIRDDPAELLGHVNCPTLLVWGERDVLVTRPMGERLRESLANSHLVVIPGAGHNVMYDRAAAFNATVIPFLLNPTEVLKTG
ncbi:AB hydrolase superfamily protein YdjP [Calidithermus terrae]|uniref:AB hydrolase superfamily protein YdjP n=1 Tax=Calidithermus terrae TaxID=1408545 RepID=A0A399EU66_9DEIN|nr:alpha/beta hydrolase [Calidithermus terrae]RIH86152.1 AB hydrolase superfamily protein YdjP [Calidithermus terrae]